MATLTSKQRSSMSDSSFAYVDSKGVGHLPINDEGHVRAALGRFNQTQFESPAKKAAAARKIRAKAKSLGIDVADDSAVAKAAMAESDNRHTHAKAGGGTYSHGHENAPKGHRHSVDDEDNASGSALLPSVAAMSEAAVISLRFNERTPLAEGEPIDYLCTGEWVFPHLNQGKPVTIVRDDLETIKRLFDEHAYGQDLPIIDEEHHDTRAAGWIKSMDFHPTDPDRLVVYPDWNPGNENLVTDGAYRYTSPVLLLNWQDPETGRVYPVVPGGLGLDPSDPEGDTHAHALTNKPRIKRLNARIAASEKAEAAIVAFSEPGTVHTGKPADCVKALMADQDADGDDDGPVPCCIYQPPYGRCPGYTRWPGDTDGDGVCLMATRDCNGYIACADGTEPPSPPYYSMFATNSTNSHEGHRMTGDQPNAAAAPADPTPTTAPSSDAQMRADLSEMQKLLAAEETARKASEDRVTKLELALRARDEDDKVRTVTARLAELAKRLPPVVLDKLAGPATDGQRDRARLLQLGENPMALDALEAVPVTRGVSLSEIGHGQDVDLESAYTQLQKFAEEIRKAEPKLTAQQAMVKASEEHPELVAAYRTERKRRLPMVLED